jgi:hypothetical protein
MATLTENTNIMKFYKWLFGKRKNKKFLKQVKFSKLLAFQNILLLKEKF